MHSKPPKLTTDLSLRNEESGQIAHQESEALRYYLQAATSDNTRKAYRSAIRQFENGAADCLRIEIRSFATYWPEPNYLIPEPWICT